jgi:hypothetical protein
MTQSTSRCSFVGNALSQLKVHINGALNVGCSRTDERTNFNNNDEPNAAITTNKICLFIKNESMKIEVKLFGFLLAFSIKCVCENDLSYM